MGTVALAGGGRCVYPCPKEQPATVVSGARRRVGQWVEVLAAAGRGSVFALAAELVWSAAALQPEHPPGVLARGTQAGSRSGSTVARSRTLHSRRAARRAPRPGPGAGRAPRRRWRRRASGPPRRRAEPGRETNGSGPGRLPVADRRSRLRTGAAVWGGGPRRRHRHLPPAVASSPRRSP